jgi:hypothetical protein
MRRPLFQTAPLPLLLCLACAPADDPATRQEAAPAGSLAASAREACPASDFAGFFASFAEDTALQRRWTVFPLERSSIVDAGREPGQRVDTVSEAEAEYPLIPPAFQRAADGLVGQIEEREGGGKRVTLSKPDTDWSTDYLFEPVASCWQLVRIDDASL